MIVCLSMSRSFEREGDTDFKMTDINLESNQKTLDLLQVTLLKQTGIRRTMFCIIIG